MPVSDVTSHPLADLISLHGRSAVITGGAKGLGLAIAQRLAEAGAQVVLGDVDESAALAAAEQIATTYGVTAVGAKLDVADAASISALADLAVARFGQLDIWVNNAGIYPLATALTTTDAQLDLVLNINLRGTFIGCREAAVRMLVDAAGTGKVIINIASTSAFNVNGNAAHYVASKHGVAGTTKAFATELGPKGIRVVAIAPTATKTPGLEANIQSSDAVKAGLEAFANRLPLGRGGVPDDIARVVLFSASDLAAFVTGIVIPVDGGEQAA
ncbi:SDR family NAD(P)-dependent oxidoreductase [Hymenobacter monticola]|uniref:SDR family oxidoreductase n=1 Tax=Hymenobacter monticola TaxID=1705399 RepID=A0ABY4BCK2_9BACT|nr:SDR family NAD(P)-dependent oxidoreductase [Hymenobacter monticola]UOE36509.1 SDR family oxidoreductase [Hymenobacter monticola]